MNTFRKELNELLVQSKQNNYSDNYDYRRFGVYEPKQFSAKRMIKRLIKDILSATGFYKRKNSVLDHIEELEFLYDLLEDKKSKELLIKILVFRTLGHKKIKLPINNDEYWSILKNIDQMTEDVPCIELGLMDWKLFHLSINSFGYPIDMFTHSLIIMTIIILEQYSFKSSNSLIEVTDGDIVIDAGGCYGDTALYFASKAGVNGHIYSYEFLHDNINIFNKNLKLNSELGKRVDIIKYPLWSSSGKKLFIKENGPATIVSDYSKDPDATQIETKCIDDLVQSKDLSRLNFIKMDIEGSELEALKGAEKSIRKFKPKLAISIYHKLKDFWEIPQWINNLDLDYSFYLKHVTIHCEETVLFAKIKDS